MLFKVVVLLMHIAVNCNWETMADNSAPYPPSGWRPERPFNLPRKYLPAAQANETYQTNVPKQGSRRPYFVNIQRSNDQYREDTMPQKPITNSNEGKPNNKLLNENVFLDRYTKAELQYLPRVQMQEMQQLNDRSTPVSSTKQFDVTKGQYYILNPDNSIQQVAYTTRQNQQQMMNNEFTTILKYSKVGDVNDPLYKYNSEGQLERIVRK